MIRCFARFTEHIYPRASYLALLGLVLTRRAQVEPNYSAFYQAAHRGPRE